MSVESFPGTAGAKMQPDSVVVDSLSLSRIVTDPLKSDQVMDLAAFPHCGGVATFLGVVRNHHEGEAVLALDYTAYVPLAEPMIRQIEQAVCDKYQVACVRVWHRIGYLPVGEIAILAVAYAPHRREAFLACEEVVERVKHEVPIYKEQLFADGRREFVTGCCIRPDAPSHQHRHHPAYSQAHDHVHEHQSAGR